MNSPDPSWFESILGPARRRGLRAVKRLVRPAWMRRLARRNLESRESLLDPMGPVLSLTTYGQRLSGVHYAIESIGAGVCRPSRMLLCIDHALLERGLTPELERLRARGLEIHGCVDRGPHTKYFHAMSVLPRNRPLVTADDDILYPRRWLADLVAASRLHPDLVNCHRAEVISFDEHGALRPAATWRPCSDTRPSFRNMLTGVGGVIHPPSMQEAVVRAGEAFMDCSPRNDDLWLAAVALRTGIRTRQTTPFHPVLFELPGTRAGGLARGNVQGGGNDVQMRATFTDAELAFLRHCD